MKIDIEIRTVRGADCIAKVSITDSGTVIEMNGAGASKESAIGNAFLSNIEELPDSIRITDLDPPPKEKDWSKIGAPVELGE